MATAALMGVAGEARGAARVGPLRILANEDYRCAAVNAGNTSGAERVVRGAICNTSTGGCIAVQ